MTGHVCLMILTLSLSIVDSRRFSPRRFSHRSAAASNILKEVEQLRKTVADLSKQVMMQQSFNEERIRTEGNSGVKLVRGGKRGLRNYESQSHLGPAAFGIHDHSNFDRTLGLGELIVVMNGVQFTTRHNDYKLVMPSQTSGEHHKVEDIPFPEVPHEVLSKENVQEQVEEMRQWFRAFHNQDRSLRDYTEYFKPVLCYLEGAWTLDTEIVEPFPSDRHWLDAKSWEELHEKNRFIAHTGVKNRLENTAFLPTTIIAVNYSSGDVRYAQWNYRILCSPINFDLPLSYFHQEEDLTYLVPTGQDLNQTVTSRAARFKLVDTKRKQNHQLLDKIFATIPGKDNYGANLTFSVFGESIFDTAYDDHNQLLNTGYYHRSYRSGKNGAGGTTYAALGFNDDNLWVAQTTQPRVAPFVTEQCIFSQTQDGRQGTQCFHDNLRVSYAIPLEVIYMTPLLSWNPYNITVHNDTTSSLTDGRNGDEGTRALNGVDKFHYYRVPPEFFSGPLDKSDPADTTETFLNVLCPDGEVRRVSASGTRIVLQDIEGIGQIRLRYPIAPVHDEGSSVWKELNALKDKVLRTAPGPPSSVVFEMSLTTFDPPGEHTHEFTLTFDEFQLLLAGQSISVTTEGAQEHNHDLTIVYTSRTKSFKYVSCDGKTMCLDGHPPGIRLETTNSFIKLP